MSTISQLELHNNAGRIPFTVRKWKLCHPTTATQISDLIPDQQIKCTQKAKADRPIACNTSTPDRL
eukprot:2702545-Ditylum_brightwellii.AAC.1